MSGGSSDPPANRPPVGPRYERGSRRGEAGTGALSQTSAAKGSAGAESRLLADDSHVLDEIERIIVDLQSRNAPPSPESAKAACSVPPPRVGPSEAPNENGALRSSSTSRLEGQLQAARRALDHLEDKAAELESITSLLRQGVLDAESELERVGRACTFTSGRDLDRGPSDDDASCSPPWFEGEPTHAPAATGSSNAGVDPVSFGQVPGAASPTSDAVFGRFTVERYNRTIEKLKSDQPRLVVLTMALSALVGVALLALVLYFPTVHPPIWVAALPLVWIVPIPYFLLAFRGTHRVLQRNHLNLPEAK